MDSYNTQPDGANYVYKEGDWSRINNVNPAIELIIGAENWTGNDGVSVKETKYNISKKIILGQNYPNPASENAEIKYKITKKAHVVFEILDITGKQVLLLDVGEKPVGNYKIEMDVSGLESGVYYYKMKAGEFVQTKKMAVLH